MTGYAIVESLCVTPKGDPDRNEDRLVATPDFVAVIDGATSSRPIGGRSGGSVAAETVAEALAALPAQTSARRFADAATDLLAARLGLWPDPMQARPCASVVVWSAHRNEIWRIGDCHFRIDDTEFPGEKLVDFIAYAYRRAVVRGRLRLGAATLEQQRTVAVLDQPFMELVSVQHAFANLDSDDPLAYGVIDGTPVPDRFVETRAAAGASEIVLCSDGFTRPFATLGDGLAELARLKREDPLMARTSGGSRPFPPDQACFDDTSYIRFRPQA
jgi:hypothetical protein